MQNVYENLCKTFMKILNKIVSLPSTNLAFEDIDAWVNM